MEIPLAPVRRRAGAIFPRDTMKDMLAHLEKLHKEAAECERIARLATDSVKRELFTRLADHYRVLADEVERAVRNLSGSD